MNVFTKNYYVQDVEIPANCTGIKDSNSTVKSIFVHRSNKIYIGYSVLIQPDNPEGQLSYEFRTCSGYVINRDKWNVLWEKSITFKDGE